MAALRKTLLATSLIGAGLMGSTGMAVAQEQDGVANVDDTQTTTPVEACNNNIPVNALGVQVPLQDNAAEVPVLSSSEDDGNGDAGSGVDKNCGQKTTPST